MESGLGGGSRRPHFRSLHLAADEPECQEIKEDLLAFEVGESGRLLWRNFEEANANSRFHLVETADFARVAGYLDETDTQLGPQLVVANYVLSMTNCVGVTTAALNVCCINECEQLLLPIERGIAQPTASGDALAAIVVQMSSSLFDDPRKPTFEPLKIIFDPRKPIVSELTSMVF